MRVICDPSWVTDANKPAADIESVLQGSAAQLQQHLGGMSQQIWPGLQIFMYDTALARPAPPSAVLYREVEGERVAFNWPPRETGRIAQAQLAQQLDEAATSNPALAGMSGQDRRDIAEFLRSYSAQTHDERLGYALMQQDVKTSLDGMAAFFNYQAADGSSKTLHALGLKEGSCSHCMKQPIALLADDCASASADQVRRGQLGRLAGGYHELAHLGDLHSGGFEAIQAVRAPQVLDLQSTREGLADSWMTLMMVRNLGGEGRAFVEQMAVMRAHPLGDAAHLTTSTIRATLDWIDKNPQALTTQNPCQLFEVAKTISASTALTAQQAAEIDAFKKQELGSLQMAPLLQERVQALTQPDYVRQLAQQLPDDAPSGVRHYAQDQLWALELKEASAQTLTSLNPLNTPQWQQQEQARAQQCAAELDTAQLAAARAQLEHNRRVAQPLPDVAVDAPKEELALTRSPQRPAF